jgi:hypothetical protein
MSSGTQSVNYQLCTPKRTVWRSVDVAFVACDGEGCDEVITAHDAGCIDPAATEAIREGWDVGDGGSDPDYCPAHKHLRKTEGE